MILSLIRRTYVYAQCITVMSGYSNDNMASAVFPDFTFELKRLDPKLSQVGHEVDNSIIPPMLHQETLRMFDIRSAGCYQWNSRENFSVATHNADYLNRDPQYLMRSSSMLWDQAASRIITTNKDCTAPQFSCARTEWRPMSFNHEDEIYPRICVSLLIHGGGDSCIGVPGPAGWTTLLPDRNLRGHAGREEGQCELAGDITLILGLIAFSARPRKILEAMNITFRPGSSWHGHPHVLRDDEREQRESRP